MLFFLLLLSISIARIMLRFAMAIAPAAPIVICLLGPAHGDVDHTRGRQTYILNTGYCVVVRRIGRVSAVFAAIGHITIDRTK